MESSLLQIVSESRSMSSTLEDYPLAKRPTKVRDGENGLERALKRTLANAQPDRVGVLAQLSDQTGGIAVTNNNDLSAGLTLIDTDVRAHYAITYQPSNHDFDGRFRQISVKVN